MHVRIYLNIMLFLDEAQKKFGNAKAISSDQFFGGNSDVSGPVHRVVETFCVKLLG